MTGALAASAFHSLRLDAVPDQEALRRAYELPSEAAVRKQMTELTEQTRRLIACTARQARRAVGVRRTARRQRGRGRRGMVGRLPREVGVHRAYVRLSWAS